MKQLIITPRAERDLNAIYDYIALHNPNSAFRTIERLKEICDMLKQNNQAGRMRADIAPEVRSFASGNYIVLFRTRVDGIEVVRFVDGRRNLKDVL